MFHFSTSWKHQKHLWFSDVFRGYRNGTLDQTKLVLFPEIGRMKLFLSLTRLHSRMCIRIYIFNFKKQEYKKKAKEIKEEKRISPENWLKPIVGSPGEDFYRHPHSRKQVFFCGLDLKKLNMPMQIFTSWDFCFLTHFRPLVSFYIPWKYQKNRGFRCFQAV